MINCKGRLHKYVRDVTGKVYSLYAMSREKSLLLFFDKLDKSGTIFIIFFTVKFRKDL